MSTTGIKIVVNKNTPAAVETFSHLGEVVALDSHEVTRSAVRDAQILVVRSESRVDRELLEGSAVKFVGTVTIGTDHVDLDYLRARGIAFASAPGSNANAVAEYLAAALLVWSERTGSKLEGKSIGIVGVGNVGSRVVRVAGALGLHAILNDPPLSRTTGEQRFRPLDELMDADFVSLHVPLTRSGPDATYRLFDGPRIRRMKRSAVLLNTARGAVVDTEALKQALVSGHLSAAILDVWEGEPNIDVGLLEQVMLGTPHIAGHSLDGKLNALRMVYEEACRFLSVAPQLSVEEPAHQTMVIDLPAGLTAVNEIVLHAVRKAYDIELDDRLLREIGSKPTEERGRFFARLRAEYRIRREFFNWTVSLSPEQKPAGDLLQKLGFKTIQKT